MSCCQKGFHIFLKLEPTGERLLVPSVYELAIWQPAGYYLEIYYLRYMYYSVPIWTGNALKGQAFTGGKEAQKGASANPTQPQCPRQRL